MTALKAVTESEDMLQRSTRELQQTKEDQKTHADEMKEQRSFARSQLAIAKRLSGTVDSDLPPRLKRLFRAYPCATVDELDRQVIITNSHCCLSIRIIAKDRLEKFKRVCGLVNNDVPPRLQKLFRVYPTADIEELDLQVTTAPAIEPCTPCIPQDLNYVLLLNLNSRSFKLLKAQYRFKRA